MSRLFLDTNALIDLCVARIPSIHEAMERIVSSCREGEDELLVCTHSLADATYVVENSRLFKDAIPDREKRRHVATFLREVAFHFCTVCSVDERIARAAHRNVSEPDFDDALIAECAARSEADYIISSDRNAFRSSRVPGVTPGEYLGLAAL